MIYQLWILLSPLADSVNSPQTSEIPDRSVEENGQLMESTNTMFLFTETNMKDQFFSKETPL